MSQSLPDLITYYHHNSPPKPFLAHIKYAKEKVIDDHRDKNMNRCINQEIREHLMKKKDINKKDQFDHLLPCLKSPSDPNLVYPDGAINVKNLRILMTSVFEFNMDLVRYVVRKKHMMDYLFSCAKTEYRLLSMIKSEWSDLFDQFSDCQVNGDLAITADTFLRFYFDVENLHLSLRK